jgi:hypothetical protein
MTSTANILNIHDPASFSSNEIPTGGTASYYQGKAGIALQGGGGGGIFYGFGSENSNLNDNDPTLVIARGSYSPLTVNHNANASSSSSNFQNGGYTYPEKGYHPSRTRSHSHSSRIHRHSSKTNSKSQSKSQSKSNSKGKSSPSHVIIGGRKSRRIRIKGMKKYLKSKKNCSLMILGADTTRTNKHSKKHSKRHNKKSLKIYHGGNVVGWGAPNGGPSSHTANAAYSVAGVELSPNDIALANPAPYSAYNSCHPVV